MNWNNLPVNPNNQIEKHNVHQRSRECIFFTLKSWLHFVHIVHTVMHILHIGRIMQCICCKLHIGHIICHTEHIYLHYSAYWIWWNIVTFGHDALHPTQGHRMHTVNSFNPKTSLAGLGTAAIAAAPQLAITVAIPYRRCSVAHAHLPKVKS